MTFAQKYLTGPNALKPGRIFKTDIRTLYPVDTRDAQPDRTKAQDVITAETWYGDYPSQDDPDQLYNNSSPSHPCPITLLISENMYVVKANY
jgi:hypothetical protein